MHQAATIKHLTKHVLPLTNSIIILKKPQHCHNSRIDWGSELQANSIQYISLVKLDFGERIDTMLQDWFFLVHMNESLVLVRDHIDVSR